MIKRIMLRERILKKENGLLFYGITPPKLSTDTEKLPGIAQRQIDRIKDIDIDGLILYDIQDESSRTNMPRPFPFMQTLDPDVYSKQYLGDLTIPKVIYKSVGKFTPEAFQDWIKEHEENIDLCVLVGAPSKDHVPSLSLKNAYSLKQASGSQLTIGGVTIPERHDAKGDEHLRIMHKVAYGCSFFVSQCVYSLDNAKNFLSDYYYATDQAQHDIPPIIFTLTPCGSVKTLEFMEWLGIHIPNWLKNDLQHSEDILARSVEICRGIAAELIAFAAEKHIPIGFNIESVSIRKAEIEASIQLLKDIKKMQLTKVK